jgi:hypothetical protein
MVADRYANDGIRSDRSTRTEVISPSRVAARAARVPASAGAARRP